MISNSFDKQFGDALNKEIHTSVYIKELVVDILVSKLENFYRKLTDILKQKML